MKTSPIPNPLPRVPLLLLLLAGCADRGDMPSLEPATEEPAPAIAPPPGPAPAAPPDALPLQHGVYVMAGGDCTAPSNAGLRFYDGHGISGTATHACEAIVRSRQGDTYGVDQSCVDTPAGNGPRTVESQTVTIHDRRSFTLATGRGTGRFTHCPDDVVPDYLRERAGLAS